LKEGHYGINDSFWRPGLDACSCNDMFGIARSTNYFRPTNFDRS